MNLIKNNHFNKGTFKALITLLVLASHKNKMANFCFVKFLVSHAQHDQDLVEVFLLTPYVSDSISNAHLMSP